MSAQIYALDRATGRPLAHVACPTTENLGRLHPWSLAKRVKRYFTSAGLLSEAQAACAAFELRGR